MNCSNQLFAVPLTVCNGCSSDFLLLFLYFQVLTASLEPFAAPVAVQEEVKRIKPHLEFVLTSHHQTTTRFDSRDVREQ